MIASTVTPLDRAKEFSAASPEILPVEWFTEIEPQLEGMWLVKRLLPAQGLALIYGHPGSGKSFFALDVALHIALGWEWCARRVRQGLVVYVGAEGGAGLRNRIAAFRRHHDLQDAIPFALIPTPIDMQDPNADTGRLAETVRMTAKQSGAEPALVIIDTLSKTFGGGKENTDDMATYVANCQRIASEFNCLVVKRRSKGTPDRRRRGTPFSDNMMLVC
ncbi:MAG: AAA family ATPase [Sphingobium sp.]|uniref:AAA family ATPase n=1 Tax=Sphingobium sp. TaxID=1912891 RepID=UPI0017C8CDC9|nr:AAA family ATPase [Sphingobium sp.]MBA4753621.1 AAA family ATPase [Sphingobium sp.]